MNPLLLSVKQRGIGGYDSQLKGGNNQFLNAVFGNQKQKTEKETKIDSKVEALLKAYKK